MNKNFFNTKFGTLITLLLCFIAAILFWLFVKFCDVHGFDNISQIAAGLGGRI